MVPGTTTSTFAKSAQVRDPGESNQYSLFGALDFGRPMVPGDGIEPSRGYAPLRILSPVRLPVSPPGHVINQLLRSHCALCRLPAVVETVVTGDAECRISSCGRLDSSSIYFLYMSSFS